MSTTIDQPTQSFEPQVDDPELIRADIMATREQLGETVEALAAKVDVKAHLSHARHRASEFTRSRTETVRRQWIPLAISTGVGLTVLAGLLLAGRKRLRLCAR